MKKNYFLLYALLFSVSIIAQDLSKIDLSKLTPEQVAMYKQYMASKEVPNTPVPSAESNTVRKDTLTRPITAKKESQVFGSYLFTTQNLTFEPKLDIATPLNYTLGVNDELIIDISGLYDANYKLKIGPEGTIRLPNIGPVHISGKTIDEASKLIKSEVSKSYQGVQSGTTKVNITLGNIRSIKVNVIGDATRPGTYTLPSLATVFNAIYACGGPSEQGSMRSIKVIRNGKCVADIDVYRFLTDGVIANNVILHDEDIIKFEPVISRITVNGTLKHTGKFELCTGETLSDLIRYAGGFAADAYSGLATVIRISDNQKKILDVPDNAYNSFKIHPGDELTFTGILNKYKNRIDISGAINRPGIYELIPGMTVTGLIQKAGGLKENAFLNSAFITRLRENQIPEIISFPLGDVMKGKSPDLPLLKDDKVEIKNLFDYREKMRVYISGEVQAPGTFPLVENMTLLDLIVQAKGFTSAAFNDSIELIRSIKDKKLLANSVLKSITTKYKIDKNLIADHSDGNVVLQDGDQVVVRKIPGYEAIRMVRIDGEVSRPGNYNIISKNDYISDLVTRSGGFTPFAYPQGAFLIRNPKLDESQQKINQFMSDNASKELQKSSKLDATLLQQIGVNNVKDISTVDSIQQTGTEVLNNIENTEGFVGINLTKIMENPHGNFDLRLEEGDVIYIPRELQTVRVFGEVYFPTYVKYQPGESLKTYLNGAGGVSNKANTHKIFVLYPNGTSKSTKSFLGINFYPPIMPGTQIIVPQKQVEITQKMTPAERITVLSSAVSMAALVYSILSNTLKF